MGASEIPNWDSREKPDTSAVQNVCMSSKQKAGPKVLPEGLQKAFMKNNTGSAGRALGSPRLG